MIDLRKKTKEVVIVEEKNFAECLLFFWKEAEVIGEMGREDDDKEEDEI